MTETIVTLIEEGQFPRWVRYAASTIIVLAAFVIVILMADHLRNYPLLLFFPAIFVCALLFDRGSGLFATFLSAALVFYNFPDPVKTLTINVTHVIPLLLYVAIGCGIAVVTEALRETVKSLSKEKREKALLMQELSHRTKNDLAMISSALNLQARNHADPSAREALLSAAIRVNVIARARDLLSDPHSITKVDMLSYLEDICQCLGDLLRDVRPIAVRVQGANFEIDGSRAVIIGLIVNELVTNAFKYAFPDDNGGVVSVTVSNEACLKIEVADNGVGYLDHSKKGTGSKLVRLMALQLGGDISEMSDGRGCRVILSVPNPSASATLSK